MSFAVGSLSAPTCLSTLDDETYFCPWRSSLSRLLSNITWGLYWALRGALAGDHVAFPPPFSLSSTRRCGVWWNVPFLSVINACFSLFSVVFSVFLGSFQLASVLLFPLLDFAFSLLALPFFVKSLQPSVFYFSLAFGPLPSRTISDLSSRSRPSPSPSPSLFNNTTTITNHQSYS